MAAGIASLGMLRENPPYERLEEMGNKLASGIREIAEEKGIPLQVPQVGSMFCLFFSEQPVENFEQAVSSDADAFSPVFRDCLANGIYLPPSAYETCFISSAHGDAEISRTLEQIRKALP